MMRQRERYTYLICSKSQHSVVYILFRLITSMASLSIINLLFCAKCFIVWLFMCLFYFSVFVLTSATKQANTLKCKFLNLQYGCARQCKAILFSSKISQEVEYPLLTMLHIEKKNLENVNIQLYWICILERKSSFWTNMTMI